MSKLEAIFPLWVNSMYLRMMCWDYLTFLIRHLLLRISLYLERIKFKYLRSKYSGPDLWWGRKCPICYIKIKKNKNLRKRHPRTVPIDQEWHVRDDKMTITTTITIVNHLKNPKNLIVATWSYSKTVICFDHDRPIPGYLSIKKIYSIVLAIFLT